MSANILWEPVPEKARSIPTAAPQRFLESLRALNWKEGDTLDGRHLNTIRGMAVVFGALDKNNPYHVLANAIEEFGEIRIWAQY